MDDIEKRVENKDSDNKKIDIMFNPNTAGFSTSLIITGTFMFSYMEDYFSRGFGAVMAVAGISSYYFGIK